MTTKYETVCVPRMGFDLLHSEGADFAAKVTYLGYEPGSVYDPRNGVKAEMLVPLFGVWP